MNPRKSFRAQALCLATLPLVLSCASRRCPPEVSRLGEHSREACRVDIAEVLRERGEAVRILALSGGGQNGAFGAGVLDGWRDADGRPMRFDLVTGVSTGALLATFAYLGTDAAYEVMVSTYTGVSQEDIYDSRSWLCLPFSDSIAKPDGLADLIDAIFNDEVLSGVGRIYREEGRVLLVGTADLDAGDFRPWNLSRMAAQGEFDLYRRVLLASAAIPVLFPPVEIDGALHMDGGVREQIFVRLIGEVCDRLGLDAGARPELNAIVNGGVGLARQCTNDALLDIAERSVNMLLDEALLANLQRVYAVAAEAGVGFRSIQIPEEVAGGLSGSSTFDPEEMKMLYELGFKLGPRPDAWSERPPL